MEIKGISRRFYGDRDAAARYIGHAEKLLNMLRSQMDAFDVQVAARHFLVDGAVEIDINVTYGQVIIEITHPTDVEEEKPEKPTCVLPSVGKGVFFTEYVQNGHGSITMNDEGAIMITPAFNGATWPRDIGFDFPLMGGIGNILSASPRGTASIGTVTVDYGIPSVRGYPVVDGCGYSSLASQAYQTIGALMYDPAGVYFGSPTYLFADDVNNYTPLSSPLPWWWDAREPYGTLPFSTSRKHRRAAGTAEDFWSTPIGVDLWNAVSPYWAAGMCIGDFEAWTGTTSYGNPGRLFVSTGEVTVPGGKRKFASVTWRVVGVELLDYERFGYYCDFSATASFEVVFMDKYIETSDGRVECTYQLGFFYKNLDFLFSSIWYCDNGYPAPFAGVVDGATNPDLYHPLSINSELIASALAYNNYWFELDDNGYVVKGSLPSGWSKME
jgi:hypothetical protein